MSNLIFNIRFGGWFLQLARDKPLGGSRFRLSRVPGRPKPGEPWLSVYAAPWL